MTDSPELVSIREYFERLLDEHDRQIALQFAALDKALIIAREEAQRQYAHLNALR